MLLCNNIIPRIWIGFVCGTWCMHPFSTSPDIFVTDTSNTGIENVHLQIHFFYLSTVRHTVFLSQLMSNKSSVLRYAKTVTEEQLV